MKLADMKHLFDQPMPVESQQSKMRRHEFHNPVLTCPQSLCSQSFQVFTTNTQESPGFFWAPIMKLKPQDPNCSTPTKSRLLRQKRPTLSKIACLVPTRVLPRGSSSVDSRPLVWLRQLQPVARNDEVWAFRYGKHSLKCLGKLYRLMP